MTSVSLNCSTSRLRPEKKKMVAGRERRGIAFLDGAEFAPVAEADRQERLLDDDARIQTMLGGDLRPCDPPAPFAFRDQAAEAVVGLQRITARSDEVEDLGEGLVLQSRVGRGGSKLGEQLLLLERRRAGDREDVLREHVQRSRPEILGVELAVVDGVERRAGLEIFEAVAGHDRAFAGLVEAMVGAADPLEKAGRSLGRAHLHDEVDVAPVDTEVEAGGRDESAQLARRHGRLDLAPSFLRQAAVMDADRQRPCRSPPRDPGRSARQGCACCRRRALSCAARSAP